MAIATILHQLLLLYLKLYHLLYFTGNVFIYLDDSLIEFMLYAFRRSLFGYYI